MLGRDRVGVAYNPSGYCPPYKQDSSGPASSSHEVGSVVDLPPHSATLGLRFYDGEMFPTECAIIDTRSSFLCCLWYYCLSSDGFTTAAAAPAVDLCISLLADFVAVHFMRNMEVGTVLSRLVTLSPRLRSSIRTLVSTKARQ